MFDPDTTDRLLDTVPTADEVTAKIIEDIDQIAALMNTGWIEPPMS